MECARGAKTRGGAQRSSGRGVRTRGGGRRGQRGSRASSSTRPFALDELTLVSVAELPHGIPLERPLVTRKRRRSWSPTTTSNPRELIAVEQVLSNLPTIHHESGHQDEELEISEVPSPAMFIECGGESTQSTPTSSSLRMSINTPIRPRVCRAICESEVMRVLNQGSDEEESGDSDGDYVGSMGLPRTFRSLLDTPEDEDSAGQTVIMTAGASVTSADVSSLDTTGPIFQPQNFLDFEWRAFPDSPILPELRRETFSYRQGATTDLYDPHDLFLAIWDRDFMLHIVLETNRYAQQTVQKMMDSNNIHPRSRICRWTDTSVDELYTFFAIILAMGIVVKTPMHEYWNNTKNIFSTPGFTVHMIFQRFHLLSRLIHFKNSEDLCTRNLTASEAKLFKVEPILSHLNLKFSSMYNLQQNIALNESLLQCEGWLDINQFIPNKAGAIGIKSFELCDSKTGYLWRFEVYAHSTPLAVTDELPAQLLASTPSLVLRLLQGLEHRGHTVWMDNFYNSPALARKLKSVGFDCVGTLRTNCQFVPVSITQLTKANMRPGQLAGFTSGDVDILVWRDQNRVAMISTYYGNSVSTSEDGRVKPLVVKDYNVCMGGVDRKDQMLASYPIERKRTRVWYKKLFRRLLNVSVLNAFIIHKQSNAPTILTHRNFRCRLVLSLLENHSSSANSFSSISANQSNDAARFHLPSICKNRTPMYCQGCDKAVCVFKACYATLHSN